MNRKSVYWGTLFAVILSGLIFILGLDRKNYNDYPVTVYQVYLNGESIGVIEKEDELYNLIDKEQENLKDEFNVKKIYAPIGLETTKLVTYQGKVNSVNDVYERIKDVEPFTVKGYEISIAHSEDKIEKLNVLHKEDFDKAVENTIKAFVDEETYDKYLKGEQEEIVTTGSKLTDVYIRENITIKEKYLSTEDEIYTDVNDLSRYMLFGTKETQDKHIVTAGQTIKDIADEHQLNVKEFLIVNPQIKSENALLFTGQEVNIGLVSPIISIVVENRSIEDKEVEFGREEKWDPKLMVGTTYTEQQGRNGLKRIEYYTETINGTITQVVNRGEEEIIPVINEIVVKGGLPQSQVGRDDNWAWPTKKPYVITSYFGWRSDPIDGSRSFHRGIDISGTGYGSDIYAARAGTVSRVGYAWDMGNFIYIKHDNNLQTIYMHLSNFRSDLRVGTEVYAGELVGYMGTSGKSTGTHLDFRVMQGNNYLDPLSLKYTRWKL